MLPVARRWRGGGGVCAPIHGGPALRTKGATSVLPSTHGLCSARPFPLPFPGLLGGTRLPGSGTSGTRTHLQTLGGALMEPSVVGGGGAPGAGQKLLRGSTNPGDVAAVLGKDGAARLAR